MEEGLDPLDELRVELELDEHLAPYAALGWREGVEAWPTLHLEDLSEIPFLGAIPAIETYQHRARLRARRGDLYAAVGEAPQGYEAYCQERLGLPPVEQVAVGATHGAMAVADGCAEGPAFERLVGFARGAGRLAIHPYMAIDAVWALAAQIAEAAAVEVAVVGPPPPILWLANDKGLFLDVAARVAGTDLLSESRLDHDPDRLAAALLDLARTNRRVGLKRTRCVSASGNRVFGADEARAGARALVDAFRAETECEPDEPILAVAWEDAVGSPSAQMWIEPERVRLDGIFEQRLEGPGCVFVGSEPSPWPARLHARIAEISEAVGGALGRLGYAGRASFDFIILGDPEGRFDLRLTECNGRWGGTSTPMHFVDRLFPEARPRYAARDFAHEGLRGLGFEEVAARFGETLYDARTGRGRFVLYNVGGLARSGKLDILDLAPEESALEPEILARLGLG